jgi:hypothetical protein
MNFDYLLDKNKLKRKCKNTNNECYWVPTGNIRSTVGDYVNVTLHCRNCGIREELFLTSGEFKTQEALIVNQVEKEVRNVRAS